MQSNRRAVAAYLASPVKAVEVSLGAAIKEAAVLSPNLLSHLLSVVDETHEALYPEGGGCDGEGGYLCSRRDTA